MYTCSLDMSSLSSVDSPLILLCYFSADDIWWENSTYWAAGDSCKELWHLHKWAILPCYITACFIDWWCEWNSNNANSSMSVQNIYIYIYFSESVVIQNIHPGFYVSLTSPNSIRVLGGWISIKMPSYRNRKSHCGDKTILRPSYLHNGISYTGKTTSLYWIRALGTIIV